MKAFTHHSHRLLRLLASMVAGLAIAVPAAYGGTDIGIGIPAGRDDVGPAPTVKRESYQAGRILPAPSVHAAAPVISSSSDFEWRDAAIGGGAGFVLSLLVGGAVLTVRRQRGHLRTS
jgi:hypothetical protein